MSEDLIDRKKVMDVLQQLIDKRCGCTRSSIIEKETLKLAQEVVRQCPRAEINARKI